MVARWSHDVILSPSFFSLFLGPISRVHHHHRSISLLLLTTLTHSDVYKILYNHPERFDPSNTWVPRPHLSWLACVPRCALFYCGHLLTPLHQFCPCLIFVHKTRTRRMSRSSLRSWEGPHIYRLCMTNVDLNKNNWSRTHPIFVRTSRKKP